MMCFSVCQSCSCLTDLLMSDYMYEVYVYVCVLVYLACPVTHGRIVLPQVVAHLFLQCMYTCMCEYMYACACCVWSMDACV